jgi:peroxiredoxin
MKNLIVPALIVSILIGCGGYKGVKETKEDTTLPKAPGFALANLEGKEVKLNDFDKKVVIVDFWATWCGPCRREIPDFVELYDEYKDEGFEMVGISLDKGGPKVVMDFAKKYEVNYTMLMDDGKVQNEYGPIQAIPTTFVLDQHHRIYKKYIGFRSKKTFEKDIKTLLGMQG